jgi:hypothetical protein
VPWQDIADAESIQSSDSLRYLNAYELAADDRWGLILGDYSASPPVLPTDPLMLEMPKARTGINPITRDVLVPSMSPDLGANPINGGEHDEALNELQSACIFPVGPAGPTQAYAKAQPSGRVLELVKQVGDNATLASVCPKLMDPTSVSFGYAPAVAALLSDIKPYFGSVCLPAPLPFDQTGRIVGCSLVAAGVDSDDSACDCQGAGFAELSDTKLVTEARAHLRGGFWCDTPGGPRCSSACTCEIPQLEGVAATQCTNDPAPPSETGFCYVNAMASEPNIGDPALVLDCPSANRRNLRLTGTPLPDGWLGLLICDEQVFP